MRRSVALALVALAAVISVRAVSGSRETVPLVAVPQGVSAYTFDGERIFIRREGSLTLTGFLARGPDTGAALRWCPVSQVFLDVRGRSIWDPQGRYVAGPAGRDLDRVAVSVDQTTLVVRADPARVKRARGRGNGTISGEVKLIYDNWIGGRAPLGVEFCRNAIT